MRPLPRTVFLESQVEDALRFLASGKHKGKVLIEIRREEDQTIASPTRTISAIPKIFFNPQKSYLITGGLGGVGLELANWLITKGATKLILNSRRGITNGYQTLCLRKWKQLEGIQVLIRNEDSSNFNEAEKLIEETKKIGPIGGIIEMNKSKSQQMVNYFKRYLMKDKFISDINFKYLLLTVKIIMYIYR